MTSNFATPRRDFLLQILKNILRFYEIKSESKKHKKEKEETKQGIAELKELIKQIEKCSESEALTILEQIRWIEIL